MKVAAILLVCAIAHAQNIDLNDNGCPIDPSIEKLYPHEHCDKFYQCTHGELVLHNCTSNLLFNVDKQECDWPEDVDCGNRTIPEPCENENDNTSNENESSESENECNCNPQEAPSICAKDGSDGTLIAHENCNQFYKCFNGKHVALSCPGTLLYDAYKKQCDWPENVECGDRIIPEPCENDNDNTSTENGGNSSETDNDNGNNNRTCNCNPQEAPSICTKDGSDGTLIAHENCNQFYKCYNGKPVAMNCPGELLYDPYKEQCDWPENVECGDRIIPEPCENENDNNNTENGSNSSETNNDNGSNNRTCNCNPQEAPSICTKDGSDGTLIAHENCNQFYKCYNGKPVAMNCPGELLYDPYKEQCDWPENVECGDRIIPEPCENENDNNNTENGSNSSETDNDNGNNNRPCNCNPQEAPSICAKDGSDGTLIAHENCNQFYKCYNGKPVAMNCPGELLYNSYTEQCDWPENVECGDRIIPEPCENENDNNNTENGSNSSETDNDNGSNNRTCNCNPQEAPSICAKDGSDGTLIAHENCNQFYKCYNGQPVAMNCPGELLYNSYKEQCDWPENVECGDRIIPEPCENENDNNNTENGSNSSETDNDNGNNNRTCNCNPQEAPSICAKDGSDGTLIAHENCNQFYKCYNGQPVAMKCPGVLLYNSYTEQCDWPENVECGDRIIPDPSENDNDNDSTENGGNSSETDNDNGNNNRTCNCNPQEAPSICAKDGSDGTLIAHENCNQFYKCYNGKPVAMNCPGELLYDPYKEQCDWPENVECGDRIIPEPCENENDNNNTENGSNSSETDNDNGSNNRTCNCNPQEAPSICAKDGSDGTLIAHENCNQFYKCYNGKPVAMNCPGELLYNSYTEQCDWPENVECGDRIIPEPCENENDNNNTENGSNSSETDNDNGNNNRPCNCNPQEAPSICTKDGSDGTLIAHENCNQFYKCYNGKPVAMNCPGELLYDPYKEQCDWPENVECGDRIIPEPCENENDNNNTENGSNSSETDNDNGNNNRPCNCNPQEAPSICAKDGSDGTLIAHENCNQFYKCYNGQPVAMNCPGELLYNSYTEQCDWPENVECGDRIIPEPCENENDNNNTENGSNSSETDNDNGNNNRTCNCNPQEAPSICAKDGSDGTLIAHENCNQFYKCYNGKPVAMKCPGVLLYNSYKEQCDWPENVECGDRIIPGPGENDIDNNSTENGGSSSETDNDNGNNNRTCNCNPQEAPSICAKDGSDGTLIAHENCNQFYKCYNGNPVAMNCPGELLYDPYKEQCDWPENVECGDRIISGPGENDNDNNSTENGGNSSETDNDNGNNNRTCNCNPQEAPSICAKDGSEGTLIAHENCNQFYKCFNGKPVAMNCPGELLYNSYTEQCDWPENVECGDRIIPEPCENENDNNNTENGSNSSETDNDNGNNNRTCNCNPQEAPSICAKDGSDGTLIAHENCNQFYKCYNGKPVAMNCPGELLYDPYKEQCDWPENVECGDRIIPEPCENESDNNGTENGGSGGDSENGNGTCNCNPQEAPSICARDGTNGDLVAHENCNQFYMCFNGKPHSMTCPGELLYNAHEKQCDWPEKVACGDRIIPEPSENENNSTENGGNSGESENDNNNGTCNCNPQEAPLICEKDQSNGELVAHENCNQFYQCFNRQPMPMKCPGILLYNPYKQQCDWPENVHCGDRVITPPSENDNSDSNEEDISTEIDINNNRTCNCDPNQAESICKKDNSDSTLIAHETCNKFYVCNFGMPVAMKCGNNLLYNPYKEICDWPENVDCGNRVRLESDDNEGGCNCIPTQAPLICAREGSDNTVIAHENCNQYYLCSNGKPIAFTCFSSLLYNPYKQQCDWPENVNCGYRLH
ncbi:unnamed protein product, partial [Brenthis ino]